MKIRPITEIFLRVKGEVILLNNSLEYLDKKNVYKHRINLANLLRELEISLEYIDKNIYVHNIVARFSPEVIKNSRSILCNASRFLANCLSSQ